MGWAEGKIIWFKDCETDRDATLPSKLSDHMFHLVMPSSFTFLCPNNGMYHFRPIQTVSLSSYKKPGANNLFGPVAPNKGNWRRRDTPPKRGATCRRALSCCNMTLRPCMCTKGNYHAVMKLDGISLHLR
ncbi:uncharacterized protein LOC124121399 isoform X2 [Haliotis rufescens]|uniref:uncharacterized protein LOC124121399 isoform X2 n=1 Tax=Haliotis rufescens TaxID=6454 RepID=UPI00201EB8AE|nr:uncharacterized protein LOC124121399 isoform X2 [Haliotis rufescens]